jgi:anti-repressor protein
MNELIPVTINENDEPVISGRALHSFLEIKERYNDWFPRMREYGFVENLDFTSFTEKSVKPQGGRPSADHALKIDMAKELCMLARSDKGKEARLYFIGLEKEWNSPEKVMARALKLAERTLASVRIENTALIQDKENLRRQLDESKEWYTIKRAAAINGISWQSLDWRELKRRSVIMDKQVKKIFDANFGEANIYHADVFKALYPGLIFPSEA